MGFPIITKEMKLIVQLLLGTNFGFFFFWEDANCMLVMPYLHISFSN